MNAASETAWKGVELAVVGKTVVELSPPPHLLNVPLSFHTSEKV